MSLLNFFKKLFSRKESNDHRREFESLLLRSDMLRQCLSRDHDVLSAGHLLNINSNVYEWKIMTDSLYASTVAIYGFEHKKFDCDYILKQLANFDLQEALQFKKRFFNAFENTKNCELKTDYDSDNMNNRFIFIQHNKRDSNFEKHDQLFNMILNGYRYQHGLKSCIVILFFSHETDEERSVDNHRICW